jgi:pimeloyl-ACP methyl ester carboxylesterase
MNSDLYVETIGTDSPVLILLHGVSANGAMWATFQERLDGWAGRILIPDLRGHRRKFV